MKIEGVKAVEAALKKQLAKYGDLKCSVVVGYTVNYAIYVHENMEASHPIGQAKFLERPAREHAKEIGRIVRTAMKRGVDLVTALVLGGLRLQRESQLLTPLDTSALRNSAFTAKESEKEGVSQAAFQRAMTLAKR